MDTISSPTASIADLREGVREVASKLRTYSPGDPRIFAAISRLLNHKRGEESPLVELHNRSLQESNNPAASQTARYCGEILLLLAEFLRVPSSFDPKLWKLSIEPAKAADRLEQLADKLQSTSATNPGPEQVGLFTHPELEVRNGVAPQSLRQPLLAWRKKNDAGWIEVENPKPREPRYLYDEEVVKPVILAVQNRAANEQRKKSGRKSTV